MAAQQQQDHSFDCHICLELLVDPVVGRCGHDFCLSCVQRWMQQQQSGHDQLGVRCPVCRGAFAASASELKVCIRLKTLVEKMFPGDVAARRAVLSQQAAATAAARRVQTSAQTAARAAAPSREIQDLLLQARRYVQQSNALLFPADAQQARQRAAMAAAPQRTATASAQLLRNMLVPPASQEASFPWQAFAGAETPAFGAPPPAWHSAHVPAAAPTRPSFLDSGDLAPPGLLLTAPPRSAAQLAVAPAASWLRARPLARRANLEFARQPPVPPPAAAPAASRPQTQPEFAPQPPVPPPAAAPAASRPQTQPEFAPQPPVPPPALTSQAASMLAASRRRPAQPAAVPERARQPPVPPPALNAQAASMSSAWADAWATTAQTQQ